MKLFISYASEDRDSAEAIERCCQQLSIKYFLDQKDIAIGSSITARVGDGLKQCTHLLVVVSPASEKSQWVPFEIGRAIERGMPVLPYLTHPSARPPAFLPDVLGVHGIDELKRQLEIFLLSVQGLADELVEKLARVPLVINQMEITQDAKRALSSSVNLVLEGFRDHLDDIEKGRVSVRGPEMDRVFGIFVNLVKTGFKAVSRDDLQWWASGDSRQYLAHNLFLLDKGCQVERVFVIDRDKRMRPGELQAMCDQLQKKITIRVAFLKPCRSIVGIDQDSDLDFGLFDSFAVSFFRFAAGRVHKLSTSATDYRRFSNIYDSIVNVCERFPGADGRDSSVITDPDQLRRWAEEQELLAR